MSVFWNIVNSNVDPHTYQDTVIGQEITTNNNINLYLGVSGYQGAPAMHQKGHYSVFAFMGTIENNYTTSMYVFNHKINKCSIAYNWGAYISGDYHSHGLPQFLPDGRVFMIVESNHNNQFVIKRSLRPFDITEHETIATIDDDVAYNNVIPRGDRLYMISRSYPLIEQSTRYSDDYGVTWSAPKTILSTGLYAQYWAYPKVCYPHGSNDIGVFVNINDHVNNDGYSVIYFYWLRDGRYVYNVDRSYVRDIDIAELTAADLVSYFKVTDITPHGNFPTAASCVYEDTPFYIRESTSVDGNLIFGYHNGAAWAEKQINISGVKLRDANRLELLPTGTDAFTLYCIEYTTFNDPPNLNSRALKITTDDAFDTFDYEFLFENTDDNYSIMAAHNFAETQKTAVVGLVCKVRGGGSEVEPTSAYSHFKILDVI